MTTEEMQEKLSELEAEKDALLAKTKELKAEKMKLKAKYEDVDVDSYHKLLEENETLKSNYEKLQKQYKIDTEKLSSELNSKNSHLNKVILEDGLSKTLLENGISKEYLKPALAMLKSEAKISDNFEVLIGDKPMNDFMKSWVTEGDGKLFVMKQPDVGGGAKGGSATPTTKAFKDMNEAERTELFKTNPEQFKIELNKLKQK